MRIHEAYCEELARTVSIFEARREFFELPETLRERFTFRCSDENCRATKNPLIVAVNYDKLAEATDIAQQPHFKALTKHHPHIADCPWLRAEDEHKISAPSSDPVKPAPAKQSSWTQRFTPPTVDREPDTPKLGQSGSHSPNAPEPSKTRRQPTQETRQRTGVSSTKELADIVNNWLAMTNDQRRVTQLEAGQQSVSYAHYFRQLDRMERDHNGRRIAYGTVSPVLHPKPPAEPDIIYLNFWGALTQFPVVGEKGQKLTIAMDTARLKHFRQLGHFLACITQSQQPGYLLRVFALGKIAPYREDGYRLEVAALDNLVLLAAKKKE